MRAAIITMLVVVAVLGAGGVAHATDETLPDVKGFDHRGHDAALSRMGSQPVACSRCHSIDRAGKLRSMPDSKHRPCADAGCHAPWPIPPSKEDLVKLCLVCHPQSSVSRGNLKPFYPPYKVNPDHQVTFPHATHVTLGQAALPLCSQCHADHGEGRVKHGKDAHGTCAACHGGIARPAMNDCAGCHKDIAASPPPPPMLPPNAWQLGGFSHEGHGKKAGDRARACSTCHGNLASVIQGALPHPTMQTCAGCHDGKSTGPGGRTIFSAVGTTCTRCHQLPAGVDSPPTVPQAPIRYPHAAHASIGVAIGTCATCHQLDAKTANALPGAAHDHQPCAGCHAAEFYTRSPKICGACHDDARPWQKAKLVARSGASEFGHDFSHRAHVQDLAAKENGFCQRCHQGRFAAQPVDKSHATCAACHLTDAAPRMTECAGCHQLGQGMGTLAPRDPSYPWYVRTLFDHQTHAQDPRTKQTTSCLLCHDKVVGANRLAEIGRPRMQQCDVCHDGKITFKTTGFGCARCHGSGQPAKSAQLGTRFGKLPG